MGGATRESRTRPPCRGGKKAARMNLYRLLYRVYYYDAEWTCEAFVVSSSENRAAAVLALGQLGLPFGEAWNFVRREPADHDDTGQAFELRGVAALGPALPGVKEGWYPREEALTLLDKVPETVGEYLERYPAVAAAPLDGELWQVLERARARGGSASGGEGAPAVDGGAVTVFR